VAAWNDRGLKGNHDMFIGAYARNNKDPNALFTALPDFNAGDPRHGFDSPDYRQLIAAAGSEPDRTKRIQAYHKLVEYTLDQSWVVSFAPWLGPWVWRTRLQNFDSKTAIDLNNYVNPREIWLDA
jgi:ABC-type transport system substrate-binding protein